MRERKVSFKGDIKHAFAMGKPDTSVPCVVPVALPATDSCFRTLAEDLSTRPHRSIPRSSREKKLFLPSVPRVQFQMAERLKAFTVISDKFHVFWRGKMSTGSLFFLCYKTPQQCDNQKTMTSCILLVKYY